MGSFAFGIVFMATDPVSAAATNAGKWIYGFLIGALTVTIRVANPAYPEGVMLSILFMNVMAPLIDHLVVQVHLRGRRRYLEEVPPCARVTPTPSCSPPPSAWCCSLLLAVGRGRPARPAGADGRAGPQAQRAEGLQGRRRGRPRPAATGRRGRAAVRRAASSGSTSTRRPAGCSPPEHGRSPTSSSSGGPSSRSTGGPRADGSRGTRSRSRARGSGPPSTATSRSRATWPPSPASRSTGTARRRGWAARSSSLGSSASSRARRSTGPGACCPSRS